MRTQNLDRPLHVNRYALQSLTCGLTCSVRPATGFAARAISHSTECHWIGGKQFVLTHHERYLADFYITVGVYGSAPLWGRIVDTRGPRGLFVMGFFALLIGYLGIWHYYDQGLANGASSLTTFSIILLAVFSFCTGIGGNGGLASAMNSTAKSWPDKMVRICP